jgi:hypothetical protein
VGESRFSKAESIARAEKEFAAWRAFLVDQAARGRAELKGSDGWTLAEAAAHVARWQDWASRRIPAILAGERGERLDVEGKNVVWANEDRGVGFDPALERMDRAWLELQRAAEAVPHEKWRRLITALFVANTWEHYEEHLAWRPAS